MLYFSVAIPLYFRLFRTVQALPDNSESYWDKHFLIYLAQAVSEPELIIVSDDELILSHSSFDTAIQL